MHKHANFGVNMLSTIDIDIEEKRRASMNLCTDHCNLQVDQGAIAMKNTFQCTKYKFYFIILGMILQEELGCADLLHCTIVYAISPSLNY